MINIDRLNIFLLVAETQSFSSAAQRLHLSQPTVSKHIKDLELELRAELFLRNPGGVQLTEAGKILFPWARKLVRDNIELQNIMQSLDQEISGYIRIACSTTTGKYILPQMAARFRDHHPGVRISILPCVQEETTLKLLSGEADLGIASIEMAQNNLECQSLCVDHISLIAPSLHPWAERAFIEPEELLDEPMLIREPSAGTRKVLLSELAKHDITIDDLNILLEIGNAEAIVFGVAAGLGISFVSRIASAYCRTWGCSVNIPVKGIELQRRICMARKTIGPPNRATEAFWGFINMPENADLLRLPSM